MKPLIGIAGNYDDDTGSLLLKDNYINAICKAGGIPVVLPPVRDCALIGNHLAVCNGILLSGGGDLDPAWWGETPIKAKGRIQPLRDYYEIQLVRMAMQQRKSVLGICRGCQVMNVAAGGSLIQDLSGEFGHNQNAPRDFPSHEIFIENGSRLASIIKMESIKVNSFHHQAVNRPGKGIILTAYAPDGTAEALENDIQPFFIGVQWHPECLADKNSGRLFKAFVASAQIT